MLRLNLIRTGFLLGISLLLAAIVYFFASNWPGLPRMEKISLSAGLVIVLYGLSFAFAKWRALVGYRSFLSAIFLVGGCISFGVAVAILGQIYNSHADSWALFLVWAIPSLILARITRYHAFYILSYVLVHLAVWFYFYPSSVHVVHSEEADLLIRLLFALMNLALFLLVETNRLSSPLLKAAGFIVFHAALLLLTNSFAYDDYGVWMNIPYAAVIAAGFYYFIRVKLNKTFLTLNALSASAFITFKFIELAVRHGSTAFFAFGLLFVAMLLTANIWFFHYMNKLGDPAADRAEEPQREESGERRGLIVGKVVSAVITIIGVIIGSISLVGLVFLATDANEPQYTLYVISLLFVIPMVFLPRLNPSVRYTVLTVGYIGGMISIVWIGSMILTSLSLVLSAAGWIRLDGRMQRLFTYALVNFHAGILLHQLMATVSKATTLTVLILAVINAGVYAAHFRLPEGALRRHIKESGLLFSLLFLFWLTFPKSIFPYSYEVFNLLNFIVVTLSVFVFLRRNETREAMMGLVFWFAFLSFKYYDLVWSLLDISVTLALLGIIVFSITWFAARRTGISGDEDVPHPWLRRGTALIAAVVVLQTAFIAFQAVQSERLLQTGTSIKLAIKPLDPRSLLQGDYVTLNYVISTPPEPVGKELSALPAGTRVKVVLAPDGTGLHQFSRLYRDGEALHAGEVVIHAKTSGWRALHYGIETFFVPEGTGFETQRDARFAYIRVGAGGDALPERLSKE